MIWIETERLKMRPIIPEEDAEDMYLLNLDPEVVRYTGDVPFKSIEDSLEFYKNYRQYEKYKLGRFSTFLKEDMTFIGWCGLKQEDGYIDLGYRFAKPYWGQGYATESSLASLRYGFDDLNIERIVAHALKDNPASIRVMEKVGMLYEKDLVYDGHEALQYYMTSEMYKTDTLKKQNRH